MYWVTQWNLRKQRVCPNGTFSTVVVKENEKRE